MKNFPRIEFTPYFNKQRRLAPLEIKEAFFETLALLAEDPHNPFLRNHALKDKLSGYRSIDITDDWRAVFKETRSGNRTVFTFHMFGTHEELYGENV
jgi:mRNA-degrading endonuclease YafQ of YafQ-DinJ toxin-antitoxin module